MPDKQPELHEYTVIPADLSQPSTVAKYPDDAAAAAAGEADVAVRAIRSQRNSKVVFAREEGAQ